MSIQCTTSCCERDLDTNVLRVYYNNERARATVSLTHKSVGRSVGRTRRRSKHDDTSDGSTAAAARLCLSVCYPGHVRSQLGDQHTRCAAYLSIVRGPQAT